MQTPPWEKAAQVSGDTPVSEMTSCLERAALRSDHHQCISNTSRSASPTHSRPTESAALSGHCDLSQNPTAQVRQSCGSPLPLRHSITPKHPPEPSPAEDTHGTGLLVWDSCVLQSSGSRHKLWSVKRPVRRSQWTMSQVFGLPSRTR
ncbi:proline-rich protein 5-like isoform X1 [Lates japonicus]|uniref:Proline-rich protein 5-like isoform X1 n=1 Tax=Lates japonicus TaxID=270547 RepID=A0AAD3QZ85_LATJO|nr:proline-rich protein 5-like isoform X1 [Lates japonicus]